MTDEIKTFNGTGADCSLTSGDSWKSVTSVKQNIGDSWKVVF